MRAEGRTLILGATSGLGKALANRLARQGHETIEVGSSIKVTEWTGQRWKVHCDLADPESVSRLICDLEDVMVDHFVWAAGIRKPELQLPFLQFQVNIVGAIPLIEWWWDCISADDGVRHSFCAIASTSADRPRGYEPVYAATKAAQAHLVRSLAAQQLPHVMVTLFKPGGMKTPFWNRQRPDVYFQFMDPAKVAALMVELMDEQMQEGELFREILIDKSDHPELI